jgi:hypothetical protein
MNGYEFYKKGIFCRTCSGISSKNSIKWVSNGSQNKSGNAPPFYKIYTHSRHASLEGPGLIFPLVHIGISAMISVFANRIPV